MKIKFSKDYRGPGLGFLTKAREYDKWVHLAGSAAGMLMVLWILGLFGMQIYHVQGAAGRVILYPRGLVIATIVVGLLGLGLEIYQGRKRWLWEHPEDCADGPVKILPTSYDPSDGFSWLDLVADALGILLIWGVLS